MFFNTSRSVILGIYVDDVLVCVPSAQDYSSFVASLQESFRVTELHHARWFLGVHVMQSPQHLTFDQRMYVENKLKQLGLTDAHTKDIPLAPGLSSSVITSSPLYENPRQYHAVIGSLLYVARWSRPDIAFATSFLGKFSSKPTIAAWKAAQHVLCYLKGTMDTGLHFAATPASLVAYCDSDFAEDSNTRLSVSGYVF